VALYTHKDLSFEERILPQRTGVSRVARPGQIGFTAFAQLRLLQVAAMFTHLGFPAYFRALVFLLAPPAGEAGARLTASAISES
jgi:hypothetical protein